MKSTKTPKCKNCDGVGTAHIVAGLSQPIDIPCWICGAANFKGMNRDQVSWYLKLHKAFDALKAKSLRDGQVVDPTAWMMTKNAINKACGRINQTVGRHGIELRSPEKFSGGESGGIFVAFEKTPQFGIGTAFMNLRAEFREYERRLEEIPMVMARMAA